MSILHIKNLQIRFIVCYIFVIIVPIVLLSGMIYSYQNNKIRTKYLNAKEEALLSDKNYLDNKLNQMNSYYNQFTACSGLSDILEDISYSERQVVYSYQSEVLPQLNSVRNYDSYIESIEIYTDNITASRLLSEFKPLSEFYQDNSIDPSSITTKRDFYHKFWKAENVSGKLKMIYYAGFMHSANSKISGVLEINCSDDVFNSYVKDDPHTATFIYSDNSLVYSFNGDDTMNSYLLENEAKLLQPMKESYVQFCNNNKFLISSLSLSVGNIRVIQLNEVSFDALEFRPLVLNTLLCIAVFIISSIIIFINIFKPFRNISHLSVHMSQVHKPQSAPYNGPAPDDEIGDLIRTYNQMTERTNTMSDKLHHNELQLKNAQIEALQAQLNPHFFYGTLESIRMIAEANQQKLISDIAFSFGNLMRYSLSREYLVPVSREINIVEQYLNIQSKRLTDRFLVEWDVCPIDEKWRCPKFILFSMIENVFSHDISQTRRLVHIHISITSDDNDLTITAENDGPGISPERLAQIQYLQAHPEERSTMSSNNNGRSLFNINDRLQLFYGDNYGFTINSIENVKTICSVRINKYLCGFDK